MNIVKILGILLLVGGLLGLSYGGFSYMTQTHRADVGPIHLSVSERQTVNVPLWASLAAVVGGLLLLVTARKP
jgi:hypothetical protein